MSSKTAETPAAKGGAEGAPDAAAAAKNKKKKLILIGAAAAVLLLGGGGGAAFFLTGGDDAAAAEEHGEAGGHEEAGKDGGDRGSGGKGGEGEAFLDVPPMVVNLRSADGGVHTPAALWPDEWVGETVRILPEWEQRARLRFEDVGDPGPSVLEVHLPGVEVLELPLAAVRRSQGSSRR